MSIIPTKTTTGKIVNGVVKLDESVGLPNNSRVRVSFETIMSEHDLEKAKAALQAYLANLEGDPINSGGRRFSRDELNERD